MKTCLVGLFLSVSVFAFAQDEGAIVKKDRIDFNKGIFLSVGPSFTLDKDIGDYSIGFNVEAGFLKRVNRVLSIGPSISLIRFNYDADETEKSLGDAYVGYIDDPNNPNYWEGYVITLEGGDITLTSLALNLKLNFVPIRDNTVVSVYGFIKPFVSMASRSEVNGESYYYTTTDPDGLNDWVQVTPDDEPITWGPDDYEALESESKVTGGVFLGPGLEFIPAKRVSISLQVSFGYTFPISFISTKQYKDKYENSLEAYFHDEFPIVKKGFPSVNAQLGISINF